MKKTKGINKYEKFQLKRAAVYLTDEERRRLKMKLAAYGISMSQWMRSLILQFIDMPDEVYPEE